MNIRKVQKIQFILNRKTNFSFFLGIFLKSNFNRNFQLDLENYSPGFPDQKQDPVPSAALGQDQDELTVEPTQEVWRHKGSVGRACRLVRNSPGR